MTASLIETCGENEPYELESFGLSLGIFEDTNKYHLFADPDTAEFIVGAMNRQIGRPKTSCDIIFPEISEAHDGYERAYAAELRRGKRITEVLLDREATRGSEEAADVLLAQMQHIGRVIQPLVVIENPLFFPFDDPTHFWLDNEAYDILCRRGISDKPQ